jgi:hypothetical protein
MEIREKRDRGVHDCNRVWIIQGGRSSQAFQPLMVAEGKGENM